ncbi:Mth938-like domain-containing protein [uncultured Ruegeria sp.]|uniref:Mth938-like domain-containing protein n=1 Tax=uncultured Ruegeria sp. TaxID=259304 RepID=UPI00260AECD3|nr:Mth938-like domain-containing protein [uncultured Ruegeria sp.]
MRLNQVTFTDAKPVDGYGPGFFRIGGDVFEGAVLTGPAGPANWGGYADAQPLLELADEIDVLLIGTGKDMAHIPQSLRARLESAGVGVEIMNSPAACRTYNVLLSEGRRIALALIPV